LPSGLAFTPARALDAPLAAVLLLDGEAHVVDVGHHRVELDLDTQLLEPALRLTPQLRAHRRKHRGRGVEQDHAAILRRDRPERPHQGALGELGDLTGEFDTGGPGTDDDEREPALPLGRIRGHFCGLECTEDASAQLKRVVDGLHAGREGREMIVPEVGLLRARGHDDAVELDDRLHVHQLRRHRTAGDIDLLHRAQQHPDVLLLAQDQPRRGCDLANRQDAGRHLIEQRLEQVMRRIGDEGDVDIGVLQFLRRSEASEAGPDDDDAVASGLNRLSAHQGAPPAAQQPFVRYRVTCDEQ
jgi:hypothetical protein